jgi:putative transposase
MLLNYKFEIYPTEDQAITLERWMSICRMQYNSALLDKQRIYKNEKRTYKRTDMQKQQTVDKKVIPFLNEVPSQPLQEVFFRLEKAFDKFFRKEANYPKIKKHKDYRSLTFTQFGMSKQYDKKAKKNRTVRKAASFTKGGKLQISKLGTIDIKLHRKIDGKVKQVVIKKQNQKWFTIFSVEKRVQPQQPVIDNAVGIDLGIKSFAFLSNGEKIDNPNYLRKEERKLKRHQRRLSHKKKGSKNWYKQRAKVQQTHEKVANQRRDFLHRKSYHIAEAYSFVATEDLNIRNMVKNRHLAKSISDAGWGMFRHMLRYKLEQRERTFIKVKPHYTSVECSSCGHHVKKSLSVRTHVCTKCGLVMDRDENAAHNILNRGLEELYSSVS